MSTFKLWFSRSIVALAVAGLLAGCPAPEEPEPAEPEPGETAPEAEPPAPEQGADHEGAIDQARIAEHIRILASDEFEGRAPATEGGKKTEAYLEEQARAIGLESGNDGSYRQTVEMVEMELVSDVNLLLEGPDFSRSLSYGDEVMLWSGIQEEEVELADTELVFVGYGTVAPEYDWNDYADIDVTGKTVVMLVNDPGYATGDEELFNGKSMTYYGRWTYKYEEAARQGAAGAIIIHQDGPAGYGWQVVEGGWSGAQFTLDDGDDEPRLRMESWITEPVAREVFEQADLDFEQLAEAAHRRDFEPRSLGLNASATMQNRFESSQSDNIIAALPGTERPDEYVFYMAHWDHLGMDPELDNAVYNGAVDNASGTAAILEIARAFTEMDPGPERTVVFLWVTAEEQGLLGSNYYAANPVFPLQRTVGAINLDAMNSFGPTNDVTVVGFGSSELEEYLQQAAEETGRHLRPEPTPEHGYFFRSDHFSFANRGVPALYPSAGIDHVEHGEEYGRARHAEYREQRYHQPTDEFDPDRDWSGLVADAQLAFDVGRRLANTDVWPNWYEDSEFRAIRDETAQARE